MTNLTLDGGVKARGITVILSTYNRAEDLRETLDAFCKLDLTGLQVRFVIVDNNSSDETPRVIDSFSNLLPLIHLTEPRPGKNCALNNALNNVPLEEIVVFTDDDVTPQADWLQQVLIASDKWTEYSVFGGGIRIKWPNDKAEPDWCKEKWIQAICFVSNDADGDVERPHPPGVYPIGPNLWVRSIVFSDGYRFNENIGPRPKNRLMGSETSFLIGLANKGYKTIHIPKACVMHRPQAREMTPSAMLRRGYRFGKSRPHLERLKGPWKVSLLSQGVEILHGLGSIAKSYIPGDSSLRFASRFSGLMRVGKAKESTVLSLEDLFKS